MDDALKYTAEDINLYLAGKLSPAQMHALEKAALNDPFLADALEGIKLYDNTGGFEADVDELRSRLLIRTGKSGRVLRQINSLWWKVAAVLVIVVTGVALIVITGKYAGRRDNDIVKNETAFVEKQEKKVPNDTSALKADAVELKPENKKDASVQSQAAQPRVVHESKEAVKRAKTTSPQTDSVNRLAPAIRNEAEETEPVPRALSGRAPGIDIALADTSDAAFDAVIIVGRPESAANAKARVFKSEERKSIIPGNSWQQFEEYFRDSINITTADSAYTGEEEVYFTIGDDGLPDAIRVLRSLSPSHDKEAIRLLENGPEWKVKKGARQSVRLKIIF